MNYTELLSTVEGYSENDNLDSIIDTIIDVAEARLYREIDFLHARKLSTSNFNSSDGFLQLPTDFWKARYLQVLSGNTRSFLLRKDPSFINEYWPDRTATGLPKYWAMLREDATGGSANHMMIAPTPDQSYTVELHYNYRPDPMSASNTTTWLGTHAPDLLLAAVMLEVQVYDKGELASIGNSLENPGWWQNHYKAAVQRLIADQQAAAFDTYRE